MYLYYILQKYNARDLTGYSNSIIQLRATLQTWASSCFVNILNSGSREKGTAISIASDVDYLVSLTSKCNEKRGGLRSIYNSLFNALNRRRYNNVRKQNVSVRINLSGLQVDITPARKQPGGMNDHWLYISKLDTWRQTNIQKHINDVSQSGRTKEIRLLKIWRELNQLDFASIYLEYLLIDNILLYKSKEASSLADNFWYVLEELAKDTGNPLFSRIVDPANTTNNLSDLLTNAEKNKIISKAKVSIAQSNWNQIVW
jgi:hypothetical protein